MNNDVDSMVCLVTGGAGFIGTAIAEGLTKRFSRVVIVDMMHPQIHKTSESPSNLPASVEFIKGDITIAAMWDSLLSTCKPTTIIHLAAETGTGQSLTESSRHSHTNVFGTSVMLDALVRHDAIPHRIVLASSRAIYGEGAWINNIDEKVIYPGQRTRDLLNRGEWDFKDATPIPAKASSTKPAPVSVYAATKLAQEHLLSSWVSAFGVELVILRLQNVYGPGQSLINSYTGILSLFCRIAREGGSIPLYEDGKMLRDFILIDDVAEAILIATKSMCINDKTYDIGTGKALSIAEIAEQIALFYNAPAPHVCGKFRFGDVRHASCEINDTTNELGWKPRYNIKQGLASLTTWIETQL